VVVFKFLNLLSQHLVIKLIAIGLIREIRHFEIMRIDNWVVEVNAHLTYGFVIDEIFQMNRKIRFKILLRL
jgi:hypothetical protein